MHILGKDENQFQYQAKFKLNYNFATSKDDGDI